MLSKTINVLVNLFVRPNLAECYWMTLKGSAVLVTILTASKNIVMDLLLVKICRPTLINWNEVVGQNPIF